MALQPDDFFRYGNPVCKDCDLLQHAVRVRGNFFVCQQRIQPFIQPCLILRHNLRGSFFDFQHVLFDQIQPFMEVRPDIFAFRFTHGHQGFHGLVHSLFDLRPVSITVEQAFFGRDHLRTSRQI